MPTRARNRTHPGNTETRLTREGRGETTAEKVRKHKAGVDLTVTAVAICDLFIDNEKYFACAAFSVTVELRSSAAVQQLRYFFHISAKNGLGGSCCLFLNREIIKYIGTKVSGTKSFSVVKPVFPP